MRVVVGILLAVVPVTVFTSTSAYAQYDSLSELRSAVRALSNTPSTSELTAVDLDIFINSAIRIVGTDLQGKISIDTIVMVNKFTRYALNSDVMNGRVAEVRWRRRIDGTDVSLLPVKEGDLGGTDTQPSVPFGYRVVGNHLIIGKSPIDGDTLFIYYPVRNAFLSAVTDTLQMDESNDIAIVLVACAMLDASRQRTTTMSLWYSLYGILKGAKYGTEAAPQQ